MPIRMYFPARQMLKKYWYFLAAISLACTVWAYLMHERLECLFDWCMFGFDMLMAEYSK